MNPYVALMLTLCLLGAFGFGIITWARRSRGVLVNGYDINRSGVEHKRCQPNKYGGVTWKKRDGSKIHLELDTSLAFKGSKGPEYDADVSNGQGRIFTRLRNGNVYAVPDSYDERFAPTRNPRQSQEILSLDGARLWYALLGGALKDIAESSKTDMNRLITMAIAAFVVLVMVVVGGLIYVVRLLQDPGEVASEAAGQLVQ